MPTPDLGALCDRATAFHEQTRATVAALGARIQAQGADPRLQAPWAHFERELLSHFEEEERLLFPALRALGAGERPEDGPWQHLLDELSRELDEVRTIADALRNAARDAGALEAPLLELLDGLEQHAEAEAEIILPAAQRALVSAGRPAEVPPPAPRAAPAAPSQGRLRRLGQRLRALVRGR